MLFEKLIKKSSILFIVFISNASFADTVIEVKAEPNKGFYFPFLLKIPSNIETNYLIVETNNTGAVSDDFEVHYQSAKKAIVGNAVGPWVAKKLNSPILIPVFPRPKTEWEMYTHALDRDTLLVESGELKRIDLQLLAMISQAKKVLSNHSVTIQDKVILTGFSASGSLANRFSMLHPDSIQLVVAGGLNGILMLPVDNVSNKKLNYPLGVNDFKKITGIDFNKTQWASVPQFLFMGENDTNDAVKYDDAYSDVERKTIYSALGQNMQPERWVKCQDIYKANNVNVVFHTYVNIGHGTNLKIHNDILNFVRKNI
jgi:predicted esterase